MGMVDNTLFTKKKSSHHIIVQIYVDDIIFDSTCQDLCGDFTKIMHDKFEMSMVGELNFFIGLQIKQLDDAIFFNQSKYFKEMLNKVELEDANPINTPMSSDTKPTKDEGCESVDSTKYRGLVGFKFNAALGREGLYNLVTTVRASREICVANSSHARKFNAIVFVAIVFEDKRY
nr:retrovirus-related Pol polyprotein from transposon TNT 1-94 [Tanacetum cinerariifolium]